MARRFKLLTGIFICLSAILLMSHNTYAEVLSIGVSPKWTNWGASWSYYATSAGSSSNFAWFTSSANTYVAEANGTSRVKQIRFNLPNGITLESGDYIVAEMVYNLEAANNSNDMIFGAMKSNTNGIGLIDVSVNRGSNAMGSIKFTFKVETTIRVTNTTTYVQIATARGSVDQYNIFWFNEAAGYLQGSVVNFYGTKNATDYTGGINDLKNGVTNLNNKLNQTNDKLDDIAENQEERAQKEDEAIDNIDNQTPSDIDDGSASNTQNIIGALQSFLSALQNLQATNCNVDLAFPSFAGGTRTVNICQNKEFTGNIVSIVGSIILVFFYLPLAFAMCRLIYNEIRSFTNG